jgi:hypothetical protein
MRSKFASWLPWTLCATASIFSVVMQLIELFTRSKPASAFENLSSFLGPLLAIALTFIAALILAHLPGHTVGWLLMISGAAAAISGPVENYINRLPTPPAAPGIPFLIMVWIQQSFWLLVIFPLLLVPLFFPTGHPPSPRWRWLGFLALGLGALFFFIATFSNTLFASVAEWQVPNPIGFLPDTFDAYWEAPFFSGLILLSLGSVAASIVRFRSGSPVERQQIKWLLYACSLFAVYYVLAYVLELGGKDYSLLRSLFFVLLILTIPLSIAISILRYRLWDIDILIRRTLVYSLLSGLLAMMYFGSVTVLQGLFTVLGGSRSTAATVISTLAIAALFNPLRRRLQDIVDRRFYRQKFDAEQSLLAFAAVARSETDLGRLTKRMLEIVQSALQPDQTLIWLKSDASKQAQNWTKK